MGGLLSSFWRHFGHVLGGSLVRCPPPTAALPLADPPPAAAHRVGPPAAVAVLPTRVDRVARLERGVGTTRRAREPAEVARPVVVEERRVPVAATMPGARPARARLGRPPEVGAGRKAATVTTPGRRASRGPRQAGDDGSARMPRRPRGRSAQRVRDDGTAVTRRHPAGRSREQVRDDDTGATRRHPAGRSREQARDDDMAVTRRRPGSRRRVEVGGTATTMRRVAIGVGALPEQTGAGRVGTQGGIGGIDSRTRWRTPRPAGVG